MFCHSCGKENGTESNFCRHCGAQLNRAAKNKKRTKSNISQKTWIIIGVVVLISGGTAYAAPKINDYLAVTGAINTAQRLQGQGQYTDALAALAAVQGRWAFQSTWQELDALKTKEDSYVQDQSSYNAAISAEASGNLTSTLQLLQSVSVDYPEYSKVQNELLSVQGQLTNQLQNQALQAQDQAKAAEAEKAQADAQAQKAAQDKAAAQAAAAAAAQAQSQADAAAAAAAQAQAQAEANAQRQVLLSFYNQLTTIYNSLVDGISYYNNAMNYYNSGSGLVALAGFGQAEAVFQKAYNDATSLNANFTGLPSAYIGAGYDMSSAANDCLQATNIMMSNIANNTNVSASASTDSCNSSKAGVNSFLTTTNP